MESDIEEQCFQCPCLQSCKTCNDFKKHIHLKDTDLVIHQHSSYQNSSKEVELVKSNPKANNGVYILHNIRSVDKITTADYVSELEDHNVSCPRCRNIIERTKILSQKTPKTDKKTSIGICGHCLKERKFQSSCYECENNLKKFIIKYERQEQSKKMKEWVSKMKNILQDVNNDSRKSTKLTSNARSDTNVEKSNQVTKPEIKILPETSGNTPQCTILDGSNKSSKFVKPKKYIQNKPTEYEVDEVMKSDKKPFHIYDEDKLSYQKITDKEVKTLKELHKNFESQSAHNLGKWKTGLRPLFDHNYPSPKINQEYRAKSGFLVRLLEKNEKHIEPKTNFEFSDSKYHKEFIKKQSSIKESESLISRETFKNISEFYSEQTQQQYIEPSYRKYSNAGSKEKIKSQSLLQNKIYDSKEALDTNFAYCFPTKTNIKETKLANGSAELILDTRNMLTTRSEKKKLNNNDKYQQRLQEKTLNKTAHEKEKRLLQKKEVKQEIYEKEVRRAEKKTAGQNKKQNKNKTVKENKLEVFTNKTNYKDNTILHKNVEEPEHNKNRETIKFDAERKDKRLKKGQDKLKSDKKTSHQIETEERQIRNNIVKTENKEYHKNKKINISKKEVQQKGEGDTESRNKSLVQQKANTETGNHKIKNQSKGNLFELAKENQDALKMKNQKKEHEKNAKEAAVKKEKECTELNITSKKEKEIPVPHRVIAGSILKELNINKIKVRRASAGDLILQHAQIKQSEAKNQRHKATRLSELNISPLCIKEHQGHKTARLSTCLMCNDSELELDVESIVLKKNLAENLTDIVIGQKIFKYKHVDNKKFKSLTVPILFETTFNGQHSLTREPQMLDFIKENTGKTPLAIPSPKSGRNVCTIQANYIFIVFTLLLLGILL